MGQYIVTVPDFVDAELVFDANEARQILKFFYPSRSAAVESMPIDNACRRLAQTMLVAAIDGSYALGFVHALLASLMPSRHSWLKGFARKLTQGTAKHWFRYATANDLQDVRVYDRVRDQIATNLRMRFDEALNGTLVHQIRRPFTVQFVAGHNVGAVWG